MSPQNTEKSVSAGIHEQSNDTKARNEDNFSKD